MVKCAHDNCQNEAMPEGHGYCPYCIELPTKECNGCNMKIPTFQETWMVSLIRYVLGWTPQALLLGIIFGLAFPYLGFHWWQGAVHGVIAGYTLGLLSGALAPCL